MKKILCDFERKYRLFYKFMQVDIPEVEYMSSGTSCIFLNL